MAEKKGWKNKLAEVVGKVVRRMVVKKAKGLAELVEENGGKELLVEKSCWLKNRVGVVGDGWQQFKVGLITWLTIK